MNKDLRQYLDVIRAAGPEFYAEVNQPLKLKYEVCVLQQKLAQRGRFPAMYCPEMEGSKLPLVTNLFGTYDGWSMAFGIDDETISRVGKSVVLQEYRKRRQQAMPVRNVSAAEAPVKEVVLRGNDVDLDLLPIPHHALLDSGRYVTIGCMICRDPDTGVPNVGVYRHEVKGKNKLGCMINPANHGAYIARRYAELGKPMEIVLFIGHHPLVIQGALTRGDINVNELEVAGGLMGEPLEVTGAETVDLPVPAWAEIAIEGVIDPRKPVTDGPFAEYLGYYGEEDKRCFLINVTAINMRHDAIFHDLDPAHREHSLVSVLGFESNAYDAAKRVVPTVQAVHIPPCASYIKIAAISLRKRVPGEAVLAGASVLMDSQIKIAIVVDEDVDVFNEQELLWAVGTRAIADQSVTVIPRALGAHLDPTAYDETRLKRGPMVSKVIIDATKPVNLPFAIRTTPPPDLWESMTLEKYFGSKPIAAV